MTDDSADTATKMADANCLPIEIISYILRFLHVSDRKESALVCRRWYNASLEPYLQRDIVVKCQLPRSGALPPSALLQRKLTHLVLSDLETGAISEEKLIYLLSKCPSLVALDLSRCNSLFLSGKLLEKEEDKLLLREKLVGVRELSLTCLRHMSDVTFLRLVSVMTGLENLSLASSNMIFGSLYDVTGGSPAMFHFSTLIKYLKGVAQNIKVLDLSFTAVNDKALSHLAKVEGLCVSTIRLQGCMEVSDKGIKELVAHQGNLQVLDLNAAKELGTNKAFFRMFTKLPKLHTTLNLRKCARVGQCDVYNLSQMPALKHLDMGEALNLYDDDVIRGLCHGKSSLHSVSLPFCPDLKDNFVVHLCESNLKLTHLDLSSCMKLTDISLHAVTKHLMFLQTLRIPYCRNVSDLGILGYKPEDGLVPNHDLEHDHVGCPCQRERESKIFRKPTGLIEQHSNSLSKLQSKVENGDELCMLSNLASLQSLDLSFCIRVTDLSLSLAIRFKELKTLSLNNLTKLTDASIIAIAKSNPSLEEVHLKSCVNLSDDAIESLLHHCRRLSVLDLCQCDGITPRCLKTFVKLGKRLKHLDLSFCGGLKPEACCEYLESELPSLKVSFRPYVYWTC